MIHRGGDRHQLLMPKHLGMRNASRNHVKDAVSVDCVRNADNRPKKNPRPIWGPGPKKSGADPRTQLNRISGEFPVPGGTKPSDARRAVKEQNR